MFGSKPSKMLSDRHRSWSRRSAGVGITGDRRRRRARERRRRGSRVRGFSIYITYVAARVVPGGSRIQLFPKRDRLAGSSGLGRFPRLPRYAAASRGDEVFRRRTRGFVRPFVLLGAGAHQTTTTVDAHPSQGFAWADTQTNETRRLVDGSAGGLAASVRLGLDFGPRRYDPRQFSLESRLLGPASGAASDYGATPQGQALGRSRARPTPARRIILTFTGRWGFGF